MQTFKLKAVITGPNANEAQLGLYDLADELRNRPWLLNSVVKWTKDQLIVTLECDSESLHLACGGVGDELCDCAVATIRSSGGIFVNVSQNVP
jgi:hypothetical protein